MRGALTILLTIIVFALVLVLAGMLYIYSGSYNVAANEPDTGLMRWILETTTDQSIGAHADDGQSVDLPTDSTSLRKGFQAYDDMCVVCHGAPGVERGWIGQGAMPVPPHLFEEGELMSDNAADVYWVIRNGIKYTGMPALEATHTDEEMKEVAAFVMQLPGMSPGEYARWRNEAASDTTASAPRDDHGHDHSHTH